MNSVQERLRHWREEVQGLSLRELRRRVNAALPEDRAVSLGTISNYETPADEEGRRRAGPRTEFLVALKRAFPELRLEWLLLGEGPPTALASRLAAPEGIEAAAGAPSGAAPTGEGRPLAARVLDRYPDLELLSPEASSLFMGALTRYAMGEPEMALDEPELLELAGDLRWLLLLALGFWGFRHAPSYDELSDYTVAFLHALMQLMPPAGRGDPVAAYRGSLGPRLRERHEVGFGR